MKLLYLFTPHPKKKPLDNVDVFVCVDVLYRSALSIPCLNEE